MGITRPGAKIKNKTTILFAKNGVGFTIIELLVVISIMAVMLLLFTVNLPGQRVDRNLNIAQNELVTNLRKAQSYTLSARQLPNGQYGEFFLLKFDGATAQSRQVYTLQAIYNASATPTPPGLVSVESYTLPPGVQVSSTPVTITMEDSTVPHVQAAGCSLLGFSAPFAQVYFNAGCVSNNFQSGDDYANILNYVVNTSGYNTTTDSYAVITLADSSGLNIRQVMVRGVSGIICPTKDGVSCSN